MAKDMAQLVGTLVFILEDCNCGRGTLPEFISQRVVTIIRHFKKLT